MLNNLGLPHQEQRKHANDAKPTWGTQSKLKSNNRIEHLHSTVTGSRVATSRLWQKNNIFFLFFLEWRESERARKTKWRKTQTGKGGEELGAVDQTRLPHQKLSNVKAANASRTLEGHFNCGQLSVSVTWILSADGKHNLFKLPPKGFGKTVSSQYTYAYSCTHKVEIAMTSKNIYNWGKQTKRSRHFHFGPDDNSQLDNWCIILKLDCTFLFPLLHFVSVAVWTVGGLERGGGATFLQWRKPYPKKEKANKT